MTSQILDLICDEAKKLQRDVRSIRRRLHQHPELSWQEYETTRFIRQFFEDDPVVVDSMELATGLCVDIGQGEGPMVVVRGDIDALPIEEQSDLSYRSAVPGVMHACGHDFHTAVLCGLGRLLLTLSDTWEGTVRLIFQPAEESGDGAQAMIDRGVLSDPRIEMIFGFHGFPRLPLGKYSVQSGPVMAACDIFDVVVHGRGGHAAMPETCVDSNVIAAEILLALQTLISREIPPTEPAVLSVGKIAGGSTRWAIPSEAHLEGTVRTLTHETQQSIKSGIQRIATTIAAAHLAHADVHYQSVAPSLVNHELPTGIVRNAVMRHFGPESIASLAPQMISEDFAFYTTLTPSCYFFVGMGTPEQDPPYDLHHPRFNANDDAIVPTLTILAQAVLDALQSS